MKIKWGGRVSQIDIIVLWVEWLEKNRARVEVFKSYKTAEPLESFIFLGSHIEMERGEAGKSNFSWFSCSFPSLSHAWKLFCQTILLKQLSLAAKTTCRAVFLNNFNSEAELCQMEAKLPWSHPHRPTQNANWAQARMMVPGLDPQDSIAELNYNSCVALVQFVAASCRRLPWCTSSRTTPHRVVTVRS